MKKRVKDADKIGKERGEGRVNREYFYPRKEFRRIEKEYRNKSLDPEAPVDRSIIESITDLFSERTTPQGETVQTAEVQEIKTPPLPGTPMPRVQTARANINPITNLTRTQEALLSPEEKIIAEEHNGKERITKIEDHEKLCRIMQKQTHDKIHKLERQINRVESILLVSTGALITGMAYVIFTLIIK